MARPQKKGIDYFPFDVGFFKDRKIKALKGRFGADGIMIYIFLLCEAYDEEYYIQADEEFIDYAAGELSMSFEKIGQVINFLCRRSLFDNTLFTSDKVLTSHGIQRRFQLAIKTRAQKTPVEVERKYWVLNESETEPYIKVVKNYGSSEKNSSSSEKNPDFSEKNSYKVKESKVKESKVYMGSENSSEPSSPKHKYGEYKNVLLSDEDMEKLKTEFPNDYLNRIERLSAYVASTGKKYKNHLATIRNWARSDKSVTNIQSSNDNNYSDLEMLARRRYD